MVFAHVQSLLRSWNVHRRRAARRPPYVTNVWNLLLVRRAIRELDGLEALPLIESARAGVRLVRPQREAFRRP
jgi:hypothetical protein